MRRLFIGVGLSGDAETAAVALLSRLQREVQHQALRWVKPEKLHVTLAFLGPVEEERVPEVVAAIADGSVGTPPFALSLGSIGGFPDLGRPKVVWLGVSESEALAHLQRNVSEQVGRLVRLEDRVYHPHVTLGRVSPGSPAVGHMVRTIGEELGDIGAEWTVNEVRLYESTSDGRYEVVETVRLPGVP